MDTITESLSELLAQTMLFIPKLIVALVVFVLSLIVAGFVSRLVRQVMEKRNINIELTLLFHKITRWSIIILGSIVALQQVDFDVTAFLAGLGFMGFTLGFAIQDVSKNFIAGLLILLQQPFNIGDAIQVGDLSGNVENIDLRATLLRTSNNKQILIPNADVFASSIINYGPADQRLMELHAGVDYECDLEFVREKALQVITAISGVCADPAPYVTFHTLGDFAVLMTLTYWIDRNQISVPQAEDAAVSAIKTTFEDAHIDMPFPTQVVHVKNN